MRSRLPAAVILAATMAAFVTGARAQAPAEGSALVAFASGGRILTIDSQGEDRRLLSGGLQAGHSDAGDSAPAFSPDGSRIAFVRTPEQGSGQRSQVFVMNADGSGQQALTPLGKSAFGDPQWSPDGATLVFGRYTSGEGAFRSAIVTVAADGGPLAVVLAQRLSERTPSILGEPSFVPGTDRISYTRVEFTRDAELIPQLRTTTAAGVDDRLLRKEASSASWSADGERVTFAGVQDHNGESCGSDECTPNGEIYVMNAGGSGAQRLTKNRGDDTEPDWTGDGSHIVFASDRNLPRAESPEIYSIRPDGDCLTWLTNGSPESSAPDAQPGAASSEPAACGAAGRKPLVETSLAEIRERGVDPAFWLGPRTGTQLLSRAPVEAGTTLFYYDDCARYDPGQCGRDILLAEDGVCTRSASLDLRSGLPEDYLVRRGALVGRFEDFNEVGVVTGGADVGIIGGRSTLGAKLKLVEELRRLGQQQPSKKLPPPRIPIEVLRKVRRAEVALRRLGSVAAVSSQLDSPPHLIRDLLRLGRALGPAGRVEAQRCGTS